MKIRNCNVSILILISKKDILDFGELFIFSVYLKGLLGVAQHPCGIAFLPPLPLLVPLLASSSSLLSANLHRKFNLVPRLLCVCVLLTRFSPPLHFLL